MSAFFEIGLLWVALSLGLDTGGDSRQYTRNEVQQLPRPISTSEDIIELVIPRNHGGRSNFVGDHI